MKRCVPLGALLLLTACGSAASPEAAPTTSAPVSVEPTTSNPPAAAPTTSNSVAVEASEQDPLCEPPIVRASDFDNDHEASIAEQTRLEPMLGQVLAYGSARPDEFSGYRLQSVAPNDSSVLIAMIGDREQHLVALEQIVEFPDELIVCTGRASGTAAQQLLDDLRAEFGNRAATTSKNTLGQVEFGLFADDVAGAEELASRYGDLVNVRVGGFPFPMPDPLPPSRCLSLADTVERADLTAAVDPPDRPLGRTGDDVRSVALDVVLTNTGDQLVEFLSGIARGYLLDKSGSVVADSGQLRISALGIEVRLEPGESMVVPLVASTSSCNPANGDVVPAGMYDLVASVPDGSGGQILSSALPVEVR